MKLVELASLLALSQIEGDGNTEITGIETDSKKVCPGDLFICLSGHTVNGHEFAANAVDNGAVAVVIQDEVKVNVPKIIVPDSRYAMAVFSNHFYGYPSRDMKVIGVTGTNGKTTTTFLIEKILSNQGFRTGLLGTISNKIGNDRSPAERTTLEAAELQKTLRKMKNANTDYCIMEVSSHALEQGRVKGCDFRTAIFTNLTQDHLDYHKTMENYKMAKGLLFARMGNTLNQQKFAILNKDDPTSEYYRKLTSAQVITYGIDNDADIRASDIHITSKGINFTVSTSTGRSKFSLNLLGKFNVYNTLAAIAATWVEGISLEKIGHSLKQLKGIEGRMEVVDEGQDFLVVVDYAHSPDGLENALNTIRQFAMRKIYCVFGCGGDRDREKRPLMGQIAAKYSDYILVTSDNPRSEDPEMILKEIEAGIIMEDFDRKRYELIVDRREAIEKAIQMAKPKDIVLICGKGHETGQTFKEVTYEFDDRLEARKVLLRSKIK